MTSHPTQQRSWIFYNDLEDLHAMPTTTLLRSHTLLLMSCPLCSHTLAPAGADLRHLPGSGPCFGYFFSLECSPDLLGCLYQIPPSLWYRFWPPSSQMHTFTCPNPYSYALAYLSFLHHTYCQLTDWKYYPRTVHCWSLFNRMCASLGSWTTII